MLENFSFAFNAIMPIVLLMAFGYWLKIRGVLNGGTLKQLNAFSYNFGLSTLMFINIYSLPSLEDIPLDLNVFVVVSIVVITAMAWVVAHFATKQRNRRGVIIQAGYRSNFAVIGTALAAALYGSEGSMMAASIQVPGVIYFNIVAVICLTIYSETPNQKIDMLDMLKKIVKNPLIIGLTAGVVCLALRGVIPRTPDGDLVFSFSGSLPFLFSPIKSMGQIASPLILIVTGGQVTFSAVGKMKKELVIGVILRLIIAPMVGFGMAFAAHDMGLINLTPPAACALMAFFGSPMAVSAAVMSETMGGDGELARQYVVWSTMLSMFTLFFWTVLLRTMGMM